MDDFLADVLTMNVPAGQERRYVASNLLAELALSMRDEHGGMDGILYPSVATALNGFNLCLTAQFADAHLKPVTCHLFEVSPGKDSGKSFVARLIGSSSKISADGEISWISAPEDELRRQDYFSRVCGPMWARGAEMVWGDIDLLVRP
ncbi:MAG TPA: hypothetical protein PK177_12750 [Burkholderiaceae bacterium]|nr:hypothetical protein [Burkholderiaceae bacterium]